MKKIFTWVLASTVAAFMLNACSKVKDLPFYSNGTPVTLQASAASVSPAPSDSLNTVISFSWTDPKYASDSNTYKYILEIDSTSRNFADKATKTVEGVRSTSLTGKELNNILLNFGFSLGTSYGLDIRIVSSYSNNNEQYTSNVVNVMVTPYGDSSSLQVTPEEVTLALNTASENIETFAWSKSFNGYSGTVTYTIQYDSAGKNFAAPTEIAAGNDVYTKTLTQGEMNETAINSGIIGGTTGAVEYRIKATTALGATVYSNVTLVIIHSYESILRFYLPGGYQAATGNGTDWTPGDAPELIRDLRPGLFNNMYYIYIYLPANSDFKVTQGRAWDINYGGTGGTLVPNGANFHVTNAGVYRITIDRSTMTYDIRDGRMGFVGGATGAGWNPPNVFPDYAMGAPMYGKNLFVGITNFSADGWKLIDNDQWNNGSNSITETRSYGSNGGSGSTMEVNAPNFPNATAGTYRVIWDGRNPDNITYTMNPATEMRIVGDGITGVPAWDPGASPQMTYNGNGIWTITTSLEGNKAIKFLAGNDWGAFDYEDNGDYGTNGSTIVRKIKWEGGDNFTTPATTGTYTITLDEYHQMVTITP